MSELKNPLVAARRGRPSKNAPIYDGDVLVFSSADHEEVNRLVKELSEHEDKAKAALIGMAKTAFELGEILFIAAGKIAGNRTVSNEKLGKMLSLDPRRIAQCVKIYVGFRERQEELENQTIRRALDLLKGDAGGKAQADDGLPASSEVAPYGGYADFGSRELEENKSEQFALPTASGVDLRRYRIRSDRNGDFWAFDIDRPQPTLIVHMTLPEPRTDSEDAAKASLCVNIEKELERYFFELEQNEK